MVLVVGGAGQGKLAWALERSGLGRESASRRVDDPVPILLGLEDLVRETLAAGEDPQGLLPYERRNRRWTPYR